MNWFITTIILTDLLIIPARAQDATKRQQLNPIEECVGPRNKPKPGQVMKVDPNCPPTGYRWKNPEKDK